MNDAELIYVADPMCSWCYGFGVELTRIRSEIDLPIRPVMGGLRPSDRAPPLDEKLKQYLRSTWAQVEAKSGQPFAFGFLDREGWVYDTEPACRAVVAMRSLAPSAAVDFFSRLQTAFYAEGHDPTDDATYPELVEAFGVDADAFLRALPTDEIRDRTRADFAEAQRLGVSGFPTLLLREGARITPLTRGYQQAAQVLRTFAVLTA